MDNEAKRKAAIEVLKALDPSQPYGPELFEELLRLNNSSAYEAVVLRQDQGRIEVLLTRRPPTELAHAGEWHCPGTFPRPKENRFMAFARLGEKEFSTRIKHWQFIAEVEMRHPPGPRGPITSKVFLVETEEIPLNQNRQWFPIDRLPQPIVDSHKEAIIPTAAEKFQEQNYRIIPDKVISRGEFLIHLC